MISLTISVISPRRTPVATLPIFPVLIQNNLFKYFSDIDAEFVNKYDIQFPEFYHIKVSKRDKISQTMYMDSTKSPYAFTYPIINQNIILQFR